jgi:hypothetical protein
VTGCSPVEGLDGRSCRLRSWQIYESRHARGGSVAPSRATFWPSIWTAKRGGRSQRSPRRTTSCLPWRLARVTSSFAYPTPRAGDERHLRTGFELRPTRLNVSTFERQTNPSRRTTARASRTGTALNMRGLRRLTAVCPGRGPQTARWVRPAQAIRRRSRLRPRPLLRVSSRTSRSDVPLPAKAVSRQRIGVLGEVGPAPVNDTAMAMSPTRSETARTTSSEALSPET